MNAISSLSSTRNDRRAINKMAHVPAQAAYDRVYRDQRPLVGGPAAHVAAKLAYAAAFDLARAQLSGVSVSRPFTVSAVTDTAIVTPPAVADIVPVVTVPVEVAPIAPASVDEPASAKRTPAVKASRGSLLEQYRAAIANATAEHGEGGNYPAPHGWSSVEGAWIIATMPKGWVPQRLVNGMRIKTPHERLRVPAARYWAGGVLPASVVPCRELDIVASRNRIAARAAADGEIWNAKTERWEWTVERKARHAAEQQEKKRLARMPKPQRDALTVARARFRYDDAEQVAIAA